MLAYRLFMAHTGIEDDVLGFSSAFCFIESQVCIPEGLVRMIIVAVTHGYANAGADSDFLFVQDKRWFQGILDTFGDMDHDILVAHFLQHQGEPVASKPAQGIYRPQYFQDTLTEPL